ncbi:tumor necrosis factor receptor superfamily member 10B isoform X2 [Amia ocellicauda]|uniref:tumor necrosis factor receptor superfamily member 10B isoform X2 n=1 Tax=Amia ocellicauda TaxID=2972642 RepID=UPI003464DF5D
MQLSCSLRLCLACICYILSAAVVKNEPLGPESNRTAHQVSCASGQYWHNGICCIECETGSYAKSHCTENAKQGVCEKCVDGTDYTEHPNGLDRCFQCKRCRTDQEEVVPCTRTHASQCQCRTGTFCHHNEACEVCKRCKKCKDGMKVVHSCNATSDVVCEKDTAVDPENPSRGVAIGIGCFVLVLIGIGIGIYWRWKKKEPERETAGNIQPTEDVIIPIETVNGGSVEEEQNSQNAGTEQQRRASEGEPLLRPKTPGEEDDDGGLGRSLSNTATSSQASLPGLSSTPRPSPVAQRAQCSGITTRKKHLIPLNGPDTLNSALHLFSGNVECKIHKKFLRNIGVTDNAIEKAKVEHPEGVEEQFYQLLRVWVQDKGLDASIDDLLNALIDLNHKRDAENIMYQAVEKKYYQRADD